MNNSALIFSLISLGFFGGFSHCVGMCGPFVLTQVSNRLQKTSLENFSNFEKLKNLTLLPYHFGRITTYSAIGFCCSILGKTINNFTNFRIISALLLFFAAIFFLQLFFEKNLLTWLKKLELPFKSKKLKKSPLFFVFFPKKISFLFQNPKGFRGYFLGLILGFIPCGLLYGSFMISTVIPNPFLAAGGMFLFGISTFPSLFLTAIGGGIFLKNPQFKIFTKIIILINSIMLFLMAFKILIT